jgi:lia operon protein LiaG
MRSRSFAVPSRAILAAGILLMAAAARAQTERKTVVGSSIAIYNIVGHVQVEAGTGSDVVVEIVRGGQDGRRLSIEVGDVRGRNSLRVIYPADEIVYRDQNDRWGRWSSTFSVRSDGTWGGEGGDDRGRFGFGGRRIRVKGSGSGLEAWADLRVLVPAGKHVDVNVGVGELSARGVNADLRLDAASAHVTATKTTGNLTIDTGSGGAEVRDATGDEITLDTGSGGVSFSGVTAKRCKMDTGSGGVTGDGLSSDEINIDVGSGSVRIDDAKATRVKLDAGSGGVRFGLRTTPKYLDVDAGSGGVTISLPAITDAEIDIETGSGGIDSDFAVQVTRVERNHLRGRIGDGSGHIRIQSGSGSVRLRKN